jgi:hypothetical protein
VEGRLDVRRAAGFAVVLVALAATHRLSLLVCLGALGLSGLAALGLAGARVTLASAGVTAAFGLLLGLGVALDLLARQATFGGTLPAEDYADTKLDLSLLARDLSHPFVVAGGLALLALAVPRVRRRGLIPAVAFLACPVALAYAWIVGIPLVYLRMAYFLPLGLAVVIGAALAALAPRWPAVAVAAALTGAIAVASAGPERQRPHVLRVREPGVPARPRCGGRGIAAGEPVVTDRCWSFLSTWLLRTPTLPALARQDIQPRAELPGVEVAQAVLRGSPAAVRYARSLGVRFLLVDPSCVDGRGRLLPPPAVGQVVFESPRLVVLRLPDTPSGLPGED